MMNRLDREIIELVGRQSNGDVIKSRCTKTELEKSLNYITEQHPEFFYLDSILYIKGKRIRLEPKYNSLIERVTLLDEACAQIRKHIVSLLLGSSYEKILILHDLFERNIVYSDRNYLEAHSIVGPLVLKEGVCEGIAKAYKYILDGIGINSLIVYGRGFNPDKNSWESHAWNLVELDGQWRHIDVTFDITIRGTEFLRYDYFFLTDSQISVDHEFDGSKYPEAEGRINDYYTSNNLVMNRRDDFKTLLLTALKDKKKIVVVRLPSEANEVGLEGKVTDILKKVLEEGNYIGEYQLFFNLKQRVFEVHFDVS